MVSSSSSFLPPFSDLASSFELSLTSLSIRFGSLSGKAMLPIPSQPTGNFIQDVCDGRPDLYGPSFFSSPTTSTSTLLASSLRKLISPSSSPFSFFHRPLLDSHNSRLHPLRLLLPLHLHLSLHRQPRGPSRSGHRKDLLRRRARLLVRNRIPCTALGGREVVGRC